MKKIEAWAKKTFKKEPFSKERFKRNLGGWLIMLPSLLLFAFFVWVPLLANIKLSFYNGTGLNQGDFVWFQNYVTVFHDVRFVKAVTNTFKYVFWSLLIGFLLPIFLGILLSETVHLKSTFRVALYFPSIISGIAVVILWSFLFDPAANAPLNAILQSLGFEPLRWLDDPQWTIPLIVITMTWRGAGGTMLIYLSNVQTVDGNLYEAARLEGATPWQRIRYVTLPHLSPTIKTLFILQIITVMQVFYEPLVMTHGGPAYSSMSLMLLSYLYFQSDNKPGLSAATGVILALLIIAMTAVYLLVVHKQKKEETAE